MRMRKMIEHVPTKMSLPLATNAASLLCNVVFGLSSVCGRACEHLRTTFTLFVHCDTAYTNKYSTWPGASGELECTITNEDQVTLCLTLLGDQEEEERKSFEYKSGIGDLESGAVRGQRDTALGNQRRLFRRSTHGESGTAWFKVGDYREVETSFPCQAISRLCRHVHFWSFVVGTVHLFLLDDARLRWRRMVLCRCRLVSMGG